MNPLEGVPNDVFEPEKLYDGPLNTVGTLSEGYLQNTNAVKLANNKLKTLCIAAKRCSENSESEE